MELNHVYLPKEIIDVCLKYLYLKSKIVFTQCNKYLYENYNKEYHKYKIYNSINNDYISFYKLLQRYKYTNNEYNDFLRISLKDTPIIGRALGFYDMRFIFELMFINQDHSIDTEEICLLNSHFFIHFYERLLNCICHDRNKTKENINHSQYLHSLKPFFNGLSREDIPSDFHCIY